MQNSEEESEDLLSGPFFFFLHALEILFIIFSDIQFQNMIKHLHVREFKMTFHC